VRSPTRLARPWPHSPIAEKLGAGRFGARDGAGRSPSGDEREQSSFIRACHGCSIDWGSLEADAPPGVPVIGVLLLSLLSPAMRKSAPQPRLGSARSTTARRTETDAAGVTICSSERRRGSAYTRRGLASRPTRKSRNRSRDRGAIRMPRRGFLGNRDGRSCPPNWGAHFLSWRASVMAHLD